MLTAIIVAAGSSRRMGFDKLFADLNGKPVVAHSVAAFQACEAVSAIIIVTRAEKQSLFRELAAQEGWTKLSRFVTGGAERHLSVWNGLETLAGAGEGDYVAVHDGARPLVTPRMIESCLALAQKTGAACCAAPVSDTLKRADAGGVVVGAVERAGLWAMHTPQIFAVQALLEAYRTVMAARGTVTDEASAMQGIGRPVALVDSGDHNFKVTYPPDLELAAIILLNRTKLKEKY